MKLRTLIVIIAVLAILLGVGLGLSRRSERFSRLALDYGRKANGLENELEGQTSPSDVRAVLDRVHWNDAVANAYRRAASRPWLSEPDPGAIVCRCGHHARVATNPGHP